MNGAGPTTNATYCATLVDQWAIEGMTHAFVAPGSRSTPLALALVEHDAVTVTLCHDERVAGFAALGSGLATGRGALVLCSSGTAGAHFYAAVIEAAASAVPLIVCTADRPPELWGKGAPQTIDQTELFGSQVELFMEPGPPDDAQRASWRPLAQRLWAAAHGARPAPVHANLSFRDPLTGVAESLTPALPPIVAESPEPLDAQLVGSIAKRLIGRTGVIIAGRNESSSLDIVELSRRLGWPLLADHRSGCRVPSATTAIRHFDSLLRDHAFGASHQPEVILRLGEIVASKAVSQWLSSFDADVVASRPHGRNIDPEDIADLQFDEAGVVAELIEQIPVDTTPAETWLAAWQAADGIAAEAIDGVLALSGQNEIGVVRSALDAVPDGGTLVVASSMPIRDLEWFGQARDNVQVLSNRGANGIDGTIATAIGVATTGRPVICLIGDVAALHDSTALIGLADRSIDLTIVVIDNDGGGIFSFLPQHELLDADRYEQLFGTPHGTDFMALATAHRLRSQAWPATLAPSGVRMVVAASNRDDNLALHDRLHASVASALARS